MIRPKDFSYFIKGGAPYAFCKKNKPNPRGGSEEDFLMFLIIHGHGGHLEFRIKTILAIIRSPFALMLHRNLVTFGPVVSEKSFESVDGRRTDDGGFPSYKLPRSLRLRGAKSDWTKHPFFGALVHTPIHACMSMYLRLGKITVIFFFFFQFS